MQNSTSLTKIIFSMVSTIIFHIGISATHGFSQDLTFNEFLATANEKWENYFSKINDIGVKYQHTQTIDGKPTFTSNSFFVYSAPCFVEEFTIGDEETVNGFNEKYFFRIKKNGKEGMWTVDSIEKNQLEKLKNSWQWLKSTDKNLMDMQGRTLPKIASPVAILGVSFLPELVQLPEFKISKISKKPKNGGEIISLEFDFQPNEHAKFPYIPIRFGKLDLLESSFFIDSAELQVGIGNDELMRVLISNEYNYINNMPYIKKQTQKFNIEGKAQLSESLFQVQVEETSPSRFTLTHYGLPEPDFGERRTNRFRFILIGAGLILISIALWQMYQKRKEQK